MNGPQGVQQVAETLLRNVGGTTVLLRTPAPAVPGDLGEQLGLAVPLFQDIAVCPVIFRRVRAKLASGAAARPVEYELMVSAVAMQRVLVSLAFDSANLLFGQALGIIIDGRLLAITGVAPAEAMGTVYLYRLTLRGSLVDVV